MEHPITWVRAAVGLAAVGYGLVATLDIVTGVTPLPNRIEQAVVALITAFAFVISRRRPRRAAMLVLGAIWVQLVLALATSSEPEPALVVFPVLVVGGGLLLGRRIPGWIAAASSVAIVAAYLVGKYRALGSIALDPHEVTWLLVSTLCTLGAGLMTHRALASYGGLLDDSEAARRRYLRLFQQAPDGLIELDAAGRIEEANAAAHRLLAEAGGPLAGRSIDEVMSTAGLAAPLDLGRATPGAPLVVELARVGGPQRSYEISVGDEPGAASGGHLLVVRDVTERRLIEGRLGHAQRLETVGQLAGGVAHDFNNLLTVIGGNAALIAESDQPGIRELANEVLEAQGRGLSLTRQLLAFGRREVRQPGPLDLREVVVGISRLLERLLGEQHRCAVAAGTSVPAVADRGQLEQVVINLVTNARDAMPAGGTVEVAVRRLGRGEAAALGSALDAPRQALLEVADHGVGMAPELQRRIFEPFFTTKPRDKGTGLGLATVLGIVVQSGGQVCVESAPGRGSRFRVFFPSAEPPPPSRPGVAGRAAPTAGHEHILLVDDDPAVAGLAFRVLSRAGYRVDVARSAEPARSLAARERFDLLLTDQVMPGASGAELAASLRAIQPGLRVLLMSGHFEAERGVVAGGPRSLLQKPFTPAELLERVRETLDRVDGVLGRSHAAE